MKKKHVLIAGLFAFFLSIPSLALADAPCLAAGSGVNLGITRLLAEAFMRKNPQAKIEIPPSIGSHGAIKAIKESAVTLGLVSRPLKDKERAAGEIFLAYARTPLVMAAHKSVPDEALTSQDIVAIYRGTKNKWSDGSEIIVLSREPHDSGKLLMEECIPGFKEAYEESYAAKRWEVLFTDQDSNAALSRTPFSFAATDLGMIATESLNAKPLALDGVPPTPEALAEGRYPMGRTLFFFYKEQGLPENVRAFLDFVYSKEGAAILRAHGYLPVHRDGALYPPM